MDEVDEPDEETTTPTARALELNKLQEKPMPELVTSRLRRRKMAWGDNLQKRRSARTEVRDIRDRFEKLISDALDVQYCFICGGGMALTNVLHQMMRT